MAVNIPLVQGNTPDEINTSLLAIKKTITAEGSKVDITINQNTNCECINIYNTDDTSGLSSANYTFSIKVKNIEEDIVPGITARIAFLSPLQSSVAITEVRISINGKNGIIKAARGGSLVNVASSEFTGGNYSSSYPHKVWDAYTTLELMWTGNEWLCMGDAILCSYSSATEGYTKKTNGLIEQWGYRSTDTNAITFLIPFSGDTSFNISYETIRTNTSGSTYGMHYVRSISKTQFQVLATNLPMYFSAIGY